MTEVNHNEVKRNEVNLQCKAPVRQGQFTTPRNMCVGSLTV